MADLFESLMKKKSSSQQATENSFTASGLDLPVDNGVFSKPVIDSPSEILDFAGFEDIDAWKFDFKLVSTFTDSFTLNSTFSLSHFRNSQNLEQHRYSVVIRVGLLVWLWMGISEPVSLLE